MVELTDRKRIALAKEQRGRCFYCHLRMLDGDMTWEHLVPRSHGGDNRLSNISIAHAKCNSAMGNHVYHLKMAVAEIGAVHGSDAFFLLAAMLKGKQTVLGHLVTRVRRPKRLPALRHGLVVAALLEMLPRDEPAMEMPLRLAA